jgi:hypothetical protein
MTLEIQPLAWDRQNHVAWLNWLIESTPSPLLMIRSPTSIHIITKDKKTSIDSILLRKTTYYHKS